MPKPLFDAAAQGHDQVPLPPMRGRYFVRSKTFNALFRAMDAILALLSRVLPGAPARPLKRLLIANGAHLGDVVMATAVLPAIRKALPDVRIGMLVGSWSEELLREHPLIDWLHCVDHWKINRAKQTRFQKLHQYCRTRRQALREIRALDYDAAIDLYFYFPNSIPLLRQSGIPDRIGYTSGGFGPLLTRRLNLTVTNQSIVRYSIDLLRLVPGLNKLDQRVALPMLPRVSLAPGPLTALGRYVVLHMGSGSRLKDWPIASWITLVATLSAHGHRLVFTGSGARESAQIAAMMDHAAEGFDLCDGLRLNEFVEVIAAAQLVVGVDSVAAHIAAAVKTPVVVVGNGMNNPFMWRPVGIAVTVVMHEVPCAPCYRKTGCETMACIRQVTPLRVYEEVTRKLKSSRSASSLGIAD